MSETISIGNRFSLLLRKIFKSSEEYGQKANTEQYAEALAQITWETKCRTYNIQRVCRHRKGGRYQPLAHTVDYAVTTHTFIDGRTRIKCALCGLEAYNKSGEDFKFAYLADLAEQSTNCPSSSERLLLGIIIGGKLVENFNNIPGVQEKIKAKYPLWDGVIKSPDEVKYVDDETKVVFTESIYEQPASDFKDIGEDTNPIKGIQPATQMDIPDQWKAIQDVSTGEVFYRAGDGTAVSLGVLPVKEEQ